MKERFSTTVIKTGLSNVLLLTLSAHAREGYSSAFSVCLSVCLSVRITSGNLRRFSP